MHKLIKPDLGNADMEVKSDFEDFIGSHGWSGVSLNVNFIVNCVLESDFLGLTVNHHSRDYQ